MSKIINQGHSRSGSFKIGGDRKQSGTKVIGSRDTVRESAIGKANRELMQRQTPSVPPPSETPASEVFTPPTLHKGVKLSLVDINGVLLKYGNDHPQQEYRYAINGLLGRCPRTVECFAKKQVPPESSFAVAAELLNSLAHHRQVETKCDYKTAFHEVVADPANSTLVAVYAQGDSTGTEVEEHSYAGDGSLSRGEAQDKLVARARAIMREQPGLTFKEAFREALKDPALKAEADLYMDLGLRV